MPTPETKLLRVAPRLRHRSAHHSDVSGSAACGRGLAPAGAVFKVMQTTLRGSVSKCSG